MLLYENFSLSFLINKPIITIEKEVDSVKLQKEKDLKSYSSIMKIIEKNDKLTFLQAENLKFLDIDILNKLNETEGDVIFTIEEINSYRTEFEKWMSPERVEIINKFIKEIENYIEQLHSIHNSISFLLNKKTA